MKKIIILMIAVILVVPMVLAFSLNPFEDIKTVDLNITSDMSKFIQNDFNSNYGAITISNSFLWVETDKIAEYSLTSTSESIIDIAMYGKVTLYQSGTLFDDINFKDKLNELTNLKDGNYYILLSKDNYIYVSNVYEEQCYTILANEINKTDEGFNCYNVSTYKLENQPIQVWEKYNGEQLKAGDYNWKFEGKRNVGQIVDVVPVKNDIEFSEWVWYDSSWNYKVEITNVSEVNIVALLRVPYNAHYSSNWSDIRFLSSDETQELQYVIYLQNSTEASFRIKNNMNTTIYMYYGNPAVASFSNVSAVYGNNLKAYWTFDEGITIGGSTIYDLTGNANATITGTTYWRTGGKGTGALQMTSNSYGSFNNAMNNYLNFTGIMSTYNYFNRTSAGQYCSIYAQDCGTSASASCIAIHTMVGNGNWYVFGGQASQALYTAYNSINTNVWYDIVGVGNATASKLYINGLPNMTGASITKSANAIIPYIGKRANGLNCVGELDEIALWNRDVSPQESYDLMAQKRAYVIYGEEQANVISCNITDVVMSVWSYESKFIDGFSDEYCSSVPMNSSYGEEIWSYSNGKFISGVGSSSSLPIVDTVGGCNLTDIAISMWCYNGAREINGIDESTSPYIPINATIGQYVWNWANGMKYVNGISG
jgi:hypothetical protein